MPTVGEPEPDPGDPVTVWDRPDPWYAPPAGYPRTHLAYGDPHRDGVPPEAVPAIPIRGFSLTELDALDVPPLEYVIDGLVPVGSLLLFAKREKEGKSLALLDAATSVAAGEAWAGRTTTAGPVIYCPAEDSIRTVRDRLERRIGTMLSGDGRPLTVAPLSGVTVVPGEAAARLDLRVPAMVAELRALVERYQPVLLVLDCLRELHSARENESDDMTATMRPLRVLAHELNVAVVVVHHASNGAAGGSRGSTAIAAACDAVATWTASGDPAATSRPGDDPASPADTGPLRATLTVRGRDVAKTTIRLELGDDLRFRPVSPAAGVGERTAANALTALSQPGGGVERSGSGRSGDPFRYRIATGPALVASGPDGSEVFEVSGGPIVMAQPIALPIPALAPLADRDAGHRDRADFWRL